MTKQEHPDFKKPSRAADNLAMLGVGQSLVWPVRNTPGPGIVFNKIMTAMSADALVQIISFEKRSISRDMGE